MMSPQFWLGWLHGSKTVSLAVRCFHSSAPRRLTLDPCLLHSQLVPKVGYRAHDVFVEHIQRVWPLRPAAEALLLRGAVDFSENELGMRRPRSTKPPLHSVVCAEKAKHPDKVLLVRVGEFYEAFGLDALLLVEHCGLNPMGSKAQAGCPAKNVQATIDGLTASGLSVAVYEEITPAKVRGLSKDRVLAQVLTPGASTYLFGSRLRRDDVHFDAESDISVGVHVSAGGAGEGSLHYAVVELSADGQYARLSERLTEEAARCLVHARGSPTLHGMLWVAGTGELPLKAKALLAPDARLARVHLDGASGTDGTSPGRAFLRAMVTAVARHLERPMLDARSVRVVASAPPAQAPRPLYAPTATQLGLLPSAQVPDLVSSLLPPRDAPAAAKALLRRWLLRPPPFAVADEVQRLVAGLRAATFALPPLSRHPLPVNKLVAMISSRNANAALFRELRHSLRNAELALRPPSGAAEQRVLGDAALALAAYESGLVLRDAEELAQRCSEVVARIEPVRVPALVRADGTPPYIQL